MIDIVMAARPIAKKEKRKRSDCGTAKHLFDGMLSNVVFDESSYNSACALNIEKNCRLYVRDARRFKNFIADSL